jgi:hypothetical protein
MRSFVMPGYDIERGMIRGDRWVRQLAHREGDAI